EARLPAQEIKKELLLDMVRQGLKTLCSVDKIGVVLETFLDTWSSRAFYGANVAVKISALRIPSLPMICGQRS
ncbi:MAG: hypothetical protein ACE10K_10715, partial [Rhodothermales bacterium]